VELELEASAREMACADVAGTGAGLGLEELAAGEAGTRVGLGLEDRSAAASEAEIERGVAELELAEELGVDVGARKSERAPRLRTAAEELELGRSYRGPKMAGCRVKTPGIFADALEQCGYPNARFVAELREFEHSGGFSLGYEGDLNARTICRNGKSTWANSGPLHAQYVKDLTAGQLIIFDTLEELNATWSGYQISPPCILPKSRFGLRRFKCGACGQEGLLRRGVEEADVACEACGSRDTSWKWRPIFNLSKSGPNGEPSVNDSVPCDEFERIKLATHQQAAEGIMRLKRQYPHERILLSMTDAASAFPTWPVRWCDARWQGAHFYDPRKPLPAYALERAPTAEEQERDCVYMFQCTMTLGCRSSMYHYCEIADAIEYLALHPDAPIPTRFPGLEFLIASYVDDALLAAPESVCQDVKQRLFEVYGLIGDYRELVALEKEEDWCEELAWCGVSLDVKNEIMAAPKLRVEAGLELLRAFIQKKFCTRTELASLIGTLSYAARCIPRGRTYLRRFIMALHKSKRRFIRLTSRDDNNEGRGIKCDCQWWISFWSEWNGVSFMREEEWRNAETLNFWTDASLDGYGACFVLPDGTAQYFGGAWSEFGIDTRDGRWSISELEALVIWMAADVWSEHLTKRRFKMRCDNMSACYMLNKGCCADGAMMVTMRALDLAMAKGSFEMRARWIGTKENVLADEASRACNDPRAWDRFFAYAHEHFGLERSSMRRVGAPAGTVALLRKMDRALAHRKRTASGEVVV